jgi:hypothetical protein
MRGSDKWCYHFPGHQTMFLRWKTIFRREKGQKSRNRSGEIAIIAMDGWELDLSCMQGWCWADACGIYPTSQLHGTHGPPVNTMLRACLLLLLLLLLLFSLSLSLMLRPFIIRVYKVDPSFKKFSNWMTRVLLEWTDHRQREVCIQESFPTTLIYSSVYPMYSHVISRVGDGARFILHLRTHRFFLSFLLLRICFC